MSDVDVIDLVKYASENKPVDFTDALDAILGNKALDALSMAKQEVAASLFKGSEETDEQDPDEEQIDDEESIETEEDSDEETGETDD